MNLNTFSRMLIPMWMGLVLAACGGGGGGGGDDNAPPAITTTSFELNRDTDLSATLTATDPESNAVTFTKTSDPAHGELIAFAASGAFTYRPDAGFTGADNFRVSASDGTSSVTATITLNVKDAKSGQTLTFAQPGPVNLFAGATLSNPASAPGSGAVAYSSDDRAIATVDDGGLVTAIAPGTVEIRASKAADATHLAAQASYTLRVLAAEDAAVAFTAWVGESATEVDFPATAASMEFFRSSAPNCDLENYASCPDGQLTILGTEPVTDTAATLNRPGYYALKSGNLVASQEINVDGFSERYGHQVVEFNGRLWLIGGVHTGTGDDEDTLTNEVWSSRDGVTWIQQQTVGDVFTPRSGHQVVVYGNKLWLIGGRGVDDILGRAIGGELNDVWSSEDGIHWEERTASAAFTPRAGHRVVVHGEQLWLVGGAVGDEVHGDVWNSRDGIVWEEVEQEEGAAMPARSGHAVVVFEEKLRLIGGLDADSGEFENDSWSSVDGVRWEKAEGGTGEIFTGRRGHQVVVRGGQLWLSAGYDDSNGSGDKNDVWFSSDGANWMELAGEAEFPAREGHQMVAFDGQLWLIGGWVREPVDGSEDAMGVGKNDVWSSRDGDIWTPQAPTVFPARGGHQVVAFKDQLWLIGGGEGRPGNDIWSSSDGIHWQEVEPDGEIFSARWGHQVVVFKGELWLIAGMDADEGKYDDLWRSEDGVHWREEESDSDIFPDRAGHQVVVFKDELWMIGGIDEEGNYLSDVWRSSDGINWTEQVGEAAFRGRGDHQVVVFDNALWVIGGLGEAEGASASVLNDVWSSADGDQWAEKAAGAAFPPRAGYQVVVYGDNLWLTGGIGPQQPMRSGEEVLDEVWSSSDGILWEPQPAGAFPAREGHQMVVYGDHLWLIGGYDENGSAQNDVWRSADGTDWRRGLRHSFQFR